MNSQERDAPSIEVNNGGKQEPIGEQEDNDLNSGTNRVDARPQDYTNDPLLVDIDKQDHPLGEPDASSVITDGEAASVPPSEQGEPQNSPFSGNDTDVSLELTPLSISSETISGSGTASATDSGPAVQEASDWPSCSRSAGVRVPASVVNKADAFKQDTRNSFCAVQRRRGSSSSESEPQDRSPAPVPPPPAPDTLQLTLKTPRPLPAETPTNHTHHLIDEHPWAGYVKPRGNVLNIDKTFVTSALPLHIYKQLGGGGYLSARFARSLFPRIFNERPSRVSPLPVFELMRLEHAVSFRKSTQAVIDQLLNRSYRFVENTRPQTPAKTMPSCVFPTITDPFPVLYQVVFRNHGQGVVLEAKDFFIVGPDRRELHFLVLDQYATNVISNTRGFDRAMLSVKDLVWVYSAEPTQAARRDPRDILTRARVPKATALDNSVPYFFRVKDFSFVTPPSAPEPILGIVLAITDRGFGVANLRIAFEGAPEAVTVSPIVCDFPIQEAEQDEVVLAISRKNSSCAMRFSEPPVSRGAQDYLCEQARLFLPSHPEEGILPLRVSKLPDEDRRWIADREGRFRNYAKNPKTARRRMGQLFNVACSALSAVNLLNDDKRTHNVTATVPSMEAFPVRLDFALPGMTSECGWTNQRPVYLWIVGAPSLCRATIQRTHFSTEDRVLSVRVVAPPWAHRGTINAVEEFGRDQGPENGVVVNAYVKLGRAPTGADPVYEIISKSRLFDNIASTVRSRALEVLHAVYGNKRMKYRPAGRSQDSNNLVIEGNRITLGQDQMSAIRLADGRYPIVGIQAAFGTGKTVVGAVIAAQAAQAGKGAIATSTTNTAVAQFADTLNKLTEYRDIVILRYVSDTALREGAPETPNDMHHILKRLHIDFAEHLSEEQERETCSHFARGRRLLERFMFDPDQALHLSEVEREEYRIAEKEISKLTSQVVLLMFRVRHPSVICLTTAALLNATDKDGIFYELLSPYTTVIGDEASQIPEPAFVAIADRLCEARHVYIGDVYQLEPHVRCPRTSVAARLGALGVMDLLESKRIPMAPLNTTFRSHSALIEPPNLLFYNHALSSGTAPSSRTLLLDNTHCPNPKVPFLLANVHGHSQRAASGSHWNEVEARTCRDVVRMLLATSIQAHSIAIISFYKEQYRHMQQFADDQQIDLYTVDAVQGREKDIVILLTTRSHFEADRALFLDEPRRMNVALTRARHGLIILGHVESLQQLANWSTLIQWARTHRTCRDASELPDLLQ